MARTKGDKELKNVLPSDADALTHHKPNSFPIQRPCPWPHHVLHIFCLAMGKVVKAATELE